MRTSSERPTHAEAGLGAVLDVDTAAIVANWRELARRHGAPAAAVLKADAYGHGACAVAPSLARAGCETFFVAHLGEALALRAVLPAARIAVLNGPNGPQIPSYRAAGIVPVLSSPGQLALWREAGGGAAFLHADTGMNRLGFGEAEMAHLAAEPALLARVEVALLMTHLVASEEPADPANALQRERFARLRALFPAWKTSLANSSGIFLGADFASDLARPGAALYGINPTPGHANPMRPAATLTAPVLQLREIRPGESVGYNATWRAERPTRIATVGIGYADGWPRVLGNTGHALFDGHVLPLVGRVSMDLTTYDATDVRGLAEGSRVTLLGEGVAAETIALWAGTNAYEVLTRIGPRVGRCHR
ncbi:MAG: alanine racemase [Rhodospirillales bacterium]|nr:alanine racemase [Rhodospirillales bacterium]